MDMNGYVKLKLLKPFGHLDVLDAKTRELVRTKSAPEPDEKERAIARGTQGFTRAI